MGDIYRNAESVLAWLGPEADDSDLVFDFLKSGNCVPSFEAVEHAFTHLNVRPYWRRAWIKQEIVLVRSISLYCGSKSVNGVNFLWWSSFSTLIQSRTSLSDEALRNGYIWSLFEHRHHRHIEPRQETLEGLLYRYCNAESTDVRDRVFALVSLASDCEGKEKEIIDYSLSSPALFFALLAYFEPTDVAKLATTLEYILVLCTAELLKFRESVISSHFNMNGTSRMEQRAFDYIRELKNYSPESFSMDLECMTKLGSESGLPDCKLPSKVRRFIFQSCLAASLMSSGIEDILRIDELIRIDNTDMAIRARPTLYGLKFIGFYKKPGAGEHMEADCYVPSTLESSTVEISLLPLFEFALLHNLSLDTDHKKLQEERDEVLAKYEVPKPSIGIVCNAINQLNSAGIYIYITDFQNILTCMFGYKLLPSTKMKMNPTAE